MSERASLIYWTDTAGGARREVPIEVTPHQHAAYATADVAQRSGRVKGATNALLAIAFALCDLADAVRAAPPQEHGDG